MLIYTIPFSINLIMYYFMLTLKYHENLFESLFQFFRYWRKCTFSPYILVFFHFGPYIFISPLLVPKPINACYFSNFRQSTNGNN